MSRWVTNTSPLIFLEEVRQHPDEASKKIEEALSSWLQVKRVRHRQIIDVLLTDLDYGEAEAIALAREIGAD